MKRTITIEGRPIEMMSNGATPILYKRMFGAELFDDTTKLVQYAQENETGKAYTILSQVAYTFAKQADTSLPEFMEWLDSMEMYSLFTALPEIIDFWASSAQPSVSPKKNNQ